MPDRAQLDTQPPEEIPETRYSAAEEPGPVHLPETTAVDDAPPGRPGPIGRPADRSGRYRIFEEIARGGMGAVLRGHDPELGRELAVKVLLDGHKDNPGLVRRFIDEAQITGQLQHPGVVPVHDVGTFDDGRPYFAMKLVKGRTLAALLKERPDPAHDLDRFLATFRVLAQTMAYAHARGVIHRDLKPSNVMVGGFGEVQVMDWGLAKVLVAGGLGGDDPTGREAAISTARSGSDVDASTAGSVLGTPAYMAPEQAAGEVARVDRRADVFGLGAILCEILTGRPPYPGRDVVEVLRRAIRGDLDDARERLGAGGIDPELSALARDCLAPRPEDRPADAGGVAARMTAYIAGVLDRVRSADLDRARAEARAIEERKRRKLQAGLGAAVLGLVALGVGGWAYNQRQRAARVARTTLAVDAILAEAAHLRADARLSPDQPGKWSEALAVAGQAEALVEQARAGVALEARVVAMIRALRDEKARAAVHAGRSRAERALLAELDAIRGGRADHRDPKRGDDEYAAAFRKAGLDLDAVDARAAGRWIAGHARPVELASFLDDWAEARALAKAPEAARLRLVEAARAADPDPWRDALRASTRPGRAGAAEEFRRLADDARALGAQPTASLVLLADQLQVSGDPERGRRVLARAWGRDPGDYWVNFELAGVAGKSQPGEKAYARPEEAARYLTAAVAIRPRSPAAHNNLGVALLAQGRPDEAAAACREAVRLRPTYALAHNNLGVALLARGRLDEAVDSFREATRLKPDYPEAHDHLGYALAARGRPDEAVASYREAIRLKPDYADAHFNLGFALQSRGKLAEAVAAYREATRLAPGLARAHTNLGATLDSLGQPDEARVSLLRARELSRGEPAAAGIDALLAGIDRREALAARLGAVLKGEDRPAGPAEALAFARLCYDRGRYAAAARLSAGALADDPGLADDRRAGHRYDAACSAALAGTGRGKDDPPPDDDARARLRAEAQGWLRAELAAWSAVVDLGKPEGRSAAPSILRHWREDADLAGVRDPAALDQLPEAEREAWRSLWEAVDELLARAEGPP